MMLAWQFTAWNLYKARPVPEGRCEVAMRLCSLCRMEAKSGQLYQTVPDGTGLFVINSRQ